MNYEMYIKWLIRIWGFLANTESCPYFERYRNFWQFKQISIDTV